MGLSVDMSVRTELEQKERLHKADGAVRWEAVCFPQIKSDQADLVWRFSQNLREQQ